MLLCIIRDAFHLERQLKRSLVHLEKSTPNLHNQYDRVSFSNFLAETYPRRRNKVAKFSVSKNSESRLKCYDKEVHNCRIGDAKHVFPEDTKSLESTQSKLFFRSIPIVVSKLERCLQSYISLENFTNKPSKGGLGKRNTLVTYKFSEGLSHKLGYPSLENTVEKSKSFLASNPGNKKLSTNGSDLSPKVNPAILNSDIPLNLAGKRVEGLEQKDTTLIQQPYSRSKVLNSRISFKIVYLIYQFESERNHFYQSLKNRLERRRKDLQSQIRTLRCKNPPVKNSVDRLLSDKQEVSEHQQSIKLFSQHLREVENDLSLLSSSIVAQPYLSLNLWKLILTPWFLRPIFPITATPNPTTSVLVSGSTKEDNLELQVIFLHLLGRLAISLLHSIHISSGFIHRRTPRFMVSLPSRKRRQLLSVSSQLKESKLDLVTPVDKLISPSVTTDRSRNLQIQPKILLGKISSAYVSRDDISLPLLDLLSNSIFPRMNVENLSLGNLNRVYDMIQVLVIVQQIGSLTLRNSAFLAPPDKEIASSSIFPGKTPSLCSESANTSDNSSFMGRRKHLLDKLTNNQSVTLDSTPQIFRILSQIEEQCLFFGMEIKSILADRSISPDVKSNATMCAKLLINLYRLGLLDDPSNDRSKNTSQLLVFQIYPMLSTNTYFRFLEIASHTALHKFSSSNVPSRKISLPQHRRLSSASANISFGAPVFDSRPLKSQLQSSLRALQTQNLVNETISKAHSSLSFHEQCDLFVYLSKLCCSSKNANPIFGFAALFSSEGVINKLIVEQECNLNHGNTIVLSTSVRLLYAMTNFLTFANPCLILGQQKAKERLEWIQHSEWFNPSYVTMKGNFKNKKIIESLESYISDCSPMIVEVLFCALMDLYKTITAKTMPAGYRPSSNESSIAPSKLEIAKEIKSISLIVQDLFILNPSLFFKSSNSSDTIGQLSSITLELFSLLNISTKVLTNIFSSCNHNLVSK